MPASRRVPVDVVRCFAVPDQLRDGISPNSVRTCATGVGEQVRMVPDHFASHSSDQFECPGHDWPSDFLALCGDDPGMGFDEPLGRDV